MPLDKTFWESLDVSVDDIIENETKLENNFLKPIQNNWVN